MLHNMACHELALASTLFGVSVERVASVQLEPELCEIVYLDNGGADWSALALTLALTLALILALTLAPKPQPLAQAPRPSPPNPIPNQVAGRLHPRATPLGQRARARLGGS